MKKLLSNLKEDARSKKITNLAIAEKISVSESQVSNWFNLKFKIPFIRFIQITSIIHENDVGKFNKYIMDYSLKITKKESVREACEWFSVNGKHQHLQKMIKTFKGFDPIVNIYDLYLKRNSKRVHPQDFYIALNRIRAEDDEIELLRDIAALYAYLDLKSYKMLFLADKILKDVDMLLNKEKKKPKNKNRKEFLYNAYKVRVKEILAIAELKKNNVEYSEALAMEIIRESKFFPLPVISMYSLLAEINVFTNYQASLVYIKKALDFCGKLSINDNKNMINGLKSTHDFIKIHNEDFDQLYLEDKAELAHFYAMKGERDKSINLLNELEVERGSLTPHQLYYKALALRDKDIMELAGQEFSNSGDSYYLKMTRKTLRKWYSSGK